MLMKLWGYLYVVVVLIGVKWRLLMFMYFFLYRVVIKLVVVFFIVNWNYLKKLILE